MFVIPGAILIGWGVGLIIHHSIAGILIGLGAGLIMEGMVWGRLVRGSARVARRWSRDLENH